MTSSITHFEIYGEEPVKLADFYRSIFGWQVEQMPGVNYWRIQIDSAEPKAGNRAPGYLPRRDYVNLRPLRRVQCQLQMLPLDG